MNELKAKFISASITNPKDPTKLPRCIVDVLIDSKATERSTAGTYRQIWIDANDSQSVWKLLKDCKFGENLDLEPYVELNGQRDRISYRILAVNK